VTFVESPPRPLAAAIPAVASTVCSTPVGFASATDIETRMIPVVKIDMLVAEIIDRVGVRIQEGRATASCHESRKQPHKRRPSNNFHLKLALGVLIPPTTTESDASSTIDSKKVPA